MDIYIFGSTETLFVERLILVIHYYVGCMILRDYFNIEFIDFAINRIKFELTFLLSLHRLLISMPFSFAFVCVFFLKN